MARTLLKLVEAPSRFCIPYNLPKFSKGVCWPITPRSWVDYPLEADTIQKFLESLFSILEAFLAAGIDPTNVSNQVPSDFKFYPEVFVQGIVQTLPYTDSKINGKIVFDHANAVLNEEVLKYRKEKTISIGATTEAEVGTKRRHLHESADDGCQTGHGSIGVWRNQAGIISKRTRVNIERDTCADDSLSLMDGFWVDTNGAERREKKFLCRREVKSSGYVSEEGALNQEGSCT
ncbi:uncharacterized protein LY89DRAFT_209519 [Mollisia scopiformis]|uniref:Uncharacterized protein n=1 Tax=Mollisia scopiformis TaxID=149040 RepID=A0A194WX18_MOLSC|nr:uncharacterized protein LY89DRAFT_209519 [Mollisia scopiformis]KUJ12526.1 hypothetical protein LY89DRAFT_209519 [Mollisia scopiformis]